MDYTGKSEYMSSSVAYCLVNDLISGLRKRTVCRAVI